MMAALGVRSIQQFNERCDKELAAGNETFRLKAKPGEEEGEEVPFEKIPYIVVVIDELADLMVVCAKDVEESLQRLAQMARAAGIHLVLATQRPSVDVLTGVIKANFPARISFQVSSRTDSRTILDQNGADHLLGSGDMLFLPPGTSKLQRLHGAFVTEDEVAELTAFLRGSGRTDLRRRAHLHGGRERRSTGRVPTRTWTRCTTSAVALVAETRNASISYVQRRLKVGYNRAARMIEQMENEGVVGPQVGTRPRDVYISAIRRPEGLRVSLSGNAARRSDMVEYTLRSLPCGLGHSCCSHSVLFAYRPGRGRARSAPVAPATTEAVQSTTFTAACAIFEAADFRVRPLRSPSDRFGIRRAGPRGLQWHGRSAAGSRARCGGPTRRPRSSECS